MNLLYACRKVAELLLLSQDEPLGILQRLKLKMHLLLCGNCRIFDAQLHTIRHLVKDSDLINESIAEDHRQSK
jgi:hypothetical protein